jgi:hypothetical protein
MKTEQIKSNSLFYEINLESIIKILLNIIFCIVITLVGFETIKYIETMSRQIETEIQYKNLEIKEKKFFMKLQEESSNASYEDIENECGH